MDIRKLQPPYEITTIDPYLEPYSGEIELRMDRFRAKRNQIAAQAKTLTEFANGAMYYGIHRTETGWVVREWLPGADAAFLIGDFNGWDYGSHPMTRGENGVWEIELEGRDALKHGQFLKLWVRHGGNAFERLPAYTTRTSMDERTMKLCCQVWDPEEPFEWTDQDFHKRPAEAPLIYEAHVGMAQDKEGIGTYREFADNILPRIRKL